MSSITCNYYNAYYTQSINNTYILSIANSTYDHYTTYQTNGVDLHIQNNAKLKEEIMCKTKVASTFNRYNITQ